MNKHGQTLIIFIILIPIFLSILALVIDVGLVISKKSELKEITKTVIKETIKDLKNDNLNEQIINLFAKNNIEVDNLRIETNEESITIKNEIEIDSIFGNILGFKKYKIKSDIKGTIKENKIIYE